MFRIAACALLVTAFAPTIGSRASLSGGDPGRAHDRARAARRAGARSRSRRTFPPRPRCRSEGRLAARRRPNSRASSRSIRPNRAVRPHATTWASRKRTSASSPRRKTPSTKRSSAIRALPRPPPISSKRRCRPAISRARARAADRFVAIAPTSLRAHYSRGLVALKQNDLADRPRRFRRADRGRRRRTRSRTTISPSPRSAPATTLPAQTELEAALALSPGYARARFALATLMLRADRRAEASADLARVIQDADDPVAARAGAQPARPLAVPRNEPAATQLEESCAFC